MNNEKKQELKHKVIQTLLDNKVVILFVLLCIGAIIASRQPLSFIASELATRIARNAFIVLALLIPVLAGMGLNFGIVIGAIAAQIAVFWVVYWGFTGITGFILCVLIATPIAILLGYLVGVLFNKMKGAEMIGGMILGYFADGLYQLFFLFIIGGIISVNNPTLIISGGIGVKNTIDLKDNLKYALDTVHMSTVIQIVGIIAIIAVLVKYFYAKKNGHELNIKKHFKPLALAVAIILASFIPPVNEFLSKDRLLLLDAVRYGTIIAAILIIGQIAYKKYVTKEEFKIKQALIYLAIAIICYFLSYLKPVYAVLAFVNLPVMTYLCIAALCVFNNALMSTKLGQDMRTVGQNRTVANAAGINVDKTRIMAMVLSTVLASWGQLIYLQNIGTFSTYGAHTQVGQFAIAALLVGGASVQKANNKQAITGVILFHTLFIAAPLAGKQLFGNAQIGEYFRVFVAYGVIAVSLAMHAWKTVVKKKEDDGDDKETLDEATPSLEA